MNEFDTKWYLSDRRGVERLLKSSNVPLQKESANGRKDEGQIHSWVWKAVDRAVFVLVRFPYSAWIHTI